MSLRIQIDCYHEYRCECKPIPQTKINKQEIAYNLIRCNPGLARYLGKTNVVAQTVMERNQMKKKQQISPYKSIVDQKNLNILLAQKYPLSKPKSPNRIELQQQPNPKPSLQLQINNYISTQVQTSPLQQKQQQKKQVKSPSQQQIKQYFKQLKQTSRYLSDTGFRKYFNKQVFQNYGRENTHGTNDGIIYGNYMKTHNINPHSGSNQPQDQETFYHALTAASPQKLLSPQAINNKTFQNRSRNLSQSRYKENKEIEQKPLKKHQNDTDQIIGDNIRYHQKLDNLSKSKSKSKVTRTVSPKIVKNTGQNYSNKVKISSKSPITKQTQQLISPAIQSQYVNTKQIIPPIRHKQQVHENKQPQSPRSDLISKKQDINRLSEIKPVQKKCPVDMIKQSHMEHIMAKQCKAKPSSVKQSILY